MRKPDLGLRTLDLGQTSQCGSRWYWPTPEVRRPLLDFRHQVRLLDVLQVDFQLGRNAFFRTALFSGGVQVQGQTTVLETLQPTLKVAIAVDRLLRGQLDPASGEALVIGRTN